MFSMIRSIRKIVKSITNQVSQRNMVFALPEQLKNWEITTFEWKLFEINGN